MVTGIVLVNVERAMIRTVIEDLMKIDGVSEVYAVAGEYDLVVMIRVQSNAELADIIATRMTHDINGIIHTKTLVTLNSYSKLDLEKIFLGN
ncbi:Lrp/AsnC ligand binding domain-containing protein [uncultured Victivallis sp.]|uniref:Lrp/AsnC family transcriptional regulator n=1 Tax=Victivallis sp. TaxID=2049020 RepID=UPI0025F28E9F|nr:Lrp/AsnC ligand binding domain-containing protein [uncultured Victivallis sp.]